MFLFLIPVSNASTEIDPGSGLVVSAEVFGPSLTGAALEQSGQVPASCLERTPRTGVGERLSRPLDDQRDPGGLGDELTAAIDSQGVRALREGIAGLDLKVDRRV